MSVHTYTTYVKGHLGSRRWGVGGVNILEQGGGEEVVINNLKETHFNLPMTNITVLSRFHTYAQKEDITL